MCILLVVGYRIEKRFVAESVHKTKTMAIKHQLLAMKHLAQSPPDVGQKTASPCAPIRPWKSQQFIILIQVQAATMEATCKMCLIRNANTDDNDTQYSLW